MRAWASTLFGVVAFSLALAGTKSGGDPSPCYGKALFIEPMSEDFGQYITTEMMNQQVRLNVTTDASRAGCIMRGTAALGGFRNTGSASLQLVGPGGDVIWSATSGDKDSVKDLGHNLVKQLKHDLQTSPRAK